MVKDENSVPNWKLELALVGGIILIQAWVLRSLLSGATTLTHDNLLWNYPVFLAYFEDIAKGVIPTYNFLSRFGEPFLPLAMHMRFVDPIETLLGGVLWHFSNDKLLVYNLFRYALALINTLGAYFFLRAYTPRLWIRGMLLVSMLFGSMFLGNFMQDGILSQFLWTPFICIFLRSRFWHKTPTPWDWFALGTMLALSFLSYWFLMPTLFIALFVALQYGAGNRFYWARPAWIRLANVAFFVVPLLLMGALNLRLYYEGKSWIYPARTAVLDDEADRPHMFTKGRLHSALNHVESLKPAGGAVTSTAWDYMQLFSPAANGRLNAGVPLTRVPYLPYRDPSEAYLFFGLIPLITAFLGVATFKSREGWVWLNLMLLFILFSFGRTAVPFKLLTSVFPVFGYVRNTHCLVMFIEFCFFYFLVVGGNYIDQKVREAALSRR
jgi:hypothetical protein